ncbi:sensor domain-containing protein [Acidovorax lacteus]|uniref:EAL domain-containing protein n=1 Tax=Acidovorax lacteus TaxID=1924988 RepID=A0ABP8L1X7_9BURK
MAHNALLAGGLLLLIVLGMTQMAPQELLKPGRRTQWTAGWLGGIVSVLVLVVLRINAPELDVVAYPTATAFMALYFGPLAAGVTALVALAGIAWSGAAEIGAAVFVLSAAWASGEAWRRVRRYAPLNTWRPMVGLAVLLPLATALALVLAGHISMPVHAGALFDTFPWYHGAGILILGAGRLLLVGKAHTTLALQAANERLREREQQLSLALDSLAGGRWEWEVPTRSFRCHGSFYETFGIEEGDAPDLWQRWYARRHPGDAARQAAKLARAMDGESEAYEAEFRVLDLEGQWRWVLSRGTVAARDATGKPQRLIGMDIDITAHREVEAALQVSETKYTTFFQTLPDAAGISRIRDGRYLDVNPAFCELFDRVHAEIVGRTSTELKIWASEQERERFVRAFERDGKVDRLPVTAQRKGVRLPGLMSARSVLIEGEQCFVFVFHDMTEAHRTSEELRAVNGLLQQAGRLARLGAWEDARGHGLVYWSDVCYDIHGLPLGAPPPAHYIDQHVAPEYREILRDCLRASILRREEWSLELEVLRADDGQRRWVRARGEPVIEGGRVTRVRGVMQDIDETKRAEQRLRQSEDRFSRIFHLMPYPMGLSRCSDGCYTDINPAWEQMLGIPRGEALGRTAIDLGIFSADQRQRLLDAVEKDGQINGYEVTLHSRTRGPLTVLQSMRRTELDGEPHWLFSVHDITDRKRNEEQVREREELLSLTLSAASLGCWDWDLAAGQISGDTRWRHLRALPVGRGPASDAPVPWATHVAVEDVERISNELARHTRHPGTPFDATWRTQAPGEPARWIRNLGKIVRYDDNAQPLRMLGVAIDVTPQREQEVLLQKLAHFDALTGLPNRVMLARRLQDCMAEAREQGTQLGVAYLDLDGFKPVNDRFGHGAGDRLLVMVAARLTRALRSVDCVARLGGDEFVLLLPGLASAAAFEQTLGHVMDQIATPYEIDSERVVVTASIGYTMFPLDEADADTLLRHADQAMYAAKQAGRNRYHQFDAEQERAQQQMRERGLQVREGLAGSQFVLYLQPKVDMRSGALVGAELLSRWQHPERGLVPPGEFLPLLEGTELEITFGEWVLEAALQMHEALSNRGLQLPLSINIAAQHLQHRGFADWMAQRMAHHPAVSASLMELEITESAALYDLQAASSALTDLRALGMSISLDDFGTGYSSLTYLRRLPMDVLKIDQSFVHGMMSDPGDLAIVQGVIGLARSFGYRVIAEGVETVEQGQMLLQLGCSHAQGYCIARPMPLDDFVRWTASWAPPPGWQRQRPG